MDPRTTKVLSPAWTLVFAAALACSGGESASTGATAAGATAAGMTTGTGTGTTGESASTSASASVSSTSSSTTGGASSTTEDSVGSTTGCSFLACDDMQASDHCSCDPWTQDCADTQKCIPVKSDSGNSWCDSCVKVDTEPKSPGEACVVADGPSDECDEASMCWSADDGAQGICFTLCEGSPDNPKCPLPATTCVIDGDLIALCFPSCNPLLQDCADGELCTFAQADGQVCAPGDLCVWDGEFVCAADASGRGGAFGELCEDGSGCEPGSACLLANYVDGCGGDRCCSPFCDTSAPNTCPGELQECSPIFAEDLLPAGYENVGICAIKQ